MKRVTSAATLLTGSRSEAHLPEEIPGHKKTRICSSGTKRRRLSVSWEKKKGGDAKVGYIIEVGEAFSITHDILRLQGTQPETTKIVS